MELRLESEVADPPKRIKPPISVTINPETDVRLRALSNATGLSASHIVRKALEDRLPVYEKDYSELLPKPDPQDQWSESE